MNKAKQMLFIVTGQIFPGRNEEKDAYVRRAE